MYPKILNDEVVGKEAKKLFKDAQELLNKYLENNWLSVDAVYGIWQAYSDEYDDIHILDFEGKGNSNITYFKTAN